MNEESSEESTDESTTKEVFIGPSQANWFKFKLGQLGMALSNNIPYFTKVPVGNRIFNWSFKVTVLSRDFEVTNESSPQNPQDQD